MAFEFPCPLCSKPVASEPDLAGRLVRCGHCGGEFVAPATVDGAHPRETRAAPLESMPTTQRFTFLCRRCGCVLEAHRGLTGHTGRCPTCGVVFVVPGFDQRTGLTTGPALIADELESPTPIHAYAAAGSRAPRIQRLADGSQMIVCPRCRGHSHVDADVCQSCGMPFTIEGAASVAARMEQPLALGTAAFVLGILSLLTVCFPLLGLVAIALGLWTLWRSRLSIGTGSTRALAALGIVMGIASLAVFLLIYVL
jgi:hypothetical protein